MMSILERKLLDDTRDRVAQLESVVAALKAEILASQLAYDYVVEAPVQKRKRKPEAQTA